MQAYQYFTDILSKQAGLVLGVDGEFKNCQPLTILISFISDFFPGEVDRKILSKAMKEAPIASIAAAI